MQSISDIFHTFNRQLTQLSSERLYSGLSNDNFLVRATQHNQQSAYLLKRYREHWPTLGLAAQTQFAQQQLCPKPLWLDKANKLAIFEYIDGVTAQGSYTAELINKLVSLHGHNVVSDAMDIQQELQHYNACELYQHYQPAVDAALTELAKLPRDTGFCHNDLVKENIIENSNGMFLIDFEYANNNDVYFDLAALVVSCELDTQGKQQLLLSYQQQLPASRNFYCSVAKLEYYQLLFLVLCICWYRARSITEKVAPLCLQLDALIAQQHNNAIDDK
jgi:thiamine kinase